MRSPLRPGSSEKCGRSHWRCNDSDIIQRVVSQLQGYRILRATVGSMLKAPTHQREQNHKYPEALT